MWVRIQMSMLGKNPLLISLFPVRKSKELKLSISSILVGGTITFNNNKYVTCQTE